MSVTHSPSQDQPYGVTLVCRAWEIPRSTFYDARERRLEGVSRAKPGPRPELGDSQLATKIQKLLTEAEERFGIHGEGYRKLHARLRHAGHRVAKDRVLRIMREHGLLSPTRVGRARGPRVHDGTIVTDRPDVMWGTDATSITTLDEGTATIFFVVDHCTGECLGIHAAGRGTRFEALEPVRQAVKRAYGDVAEGVASGLLLRHDHGSQFVSRAFQDEIAFLGIASSPSFVRAPEGNGVAERFVRTLKEQLLWLQYFRTVEELRVGLVEFAERYNASWLRARHGYLTPSQVRAKLAA